MQATLATQRLKFIPVAAEEAAFVRSALALLTDDSSEIWRRSVETIMNEHSSPSSMTALWRIATADDAQAGLIGLATPGVAVGRLRAIGWRSLETVVAMMRPNRRQGLATEAVEAIVAQALSDGVTFAVLAAVAIGNDGGHALMRRCRFEELGRVAGTAEPKVVYERAG